MKNTARTVIINLSNYRTKAPKAALTQERREQLVLETLETGYKIAHHLLKGWNYQLPGDEFKSVVGLAICEAASHYREDKNTSFSTYAFYFIKGALLKMMSTERKFSKMHSDELKDDRQLNDEQEAHGDGELHGGLGAAPESQAHLHELRRDCRKALATLTALEKEVVCRVHVLETKLAVAAREMGYSRGYISEVRGNAFKKMRGSLSLNPDFDPTFREAA